MSELKKIPQKSLVTYHGRGDTPAYIGFEKKVYDVSAVFVNGEHNGCLAGNDITDILAMMPHGTAVLEKAPLVGEIED